MSKKKHFGVPFINLESAINKVKDLYDQEGRNSVNIQIAVDHWGYSEASSGGRQTTSALKTFGLIEDLGRGEAREIQLSELALRILLDTREDSTERDNAIKAAALKPKMFEELWRKWRSTGLPSDANMLHFLIFEKGINEKSAANFVKIFKDTISFANLSASDPISEENEGDDGSTDSYKDEMSSTDTQLNISQKAPLEKKTDIRQASFSFR